MCEVQRDQSKTRKFCEHCGSWLTKSVYYDHLPCGRSISQGLKVKGVIPRVGDKFYCNHCNEAVSKSTFYEHQALYGTTINGLSSENVEPESDVDSDSENQEIIPCWDNEDRQFFSDENSSDDNEEVDGEMPPASAEGLESSIQPGQGNDVENQEQTFQFEYSDEVEEDVMDQDKEKDSNCRELRALLLFLLLWQAMFKVADRAIFVLLKFLKLFLTAIGTLIQVELLINFAKIIPETLYMIHKNLCLQKDSFIKYAVCPKCKTLYSFDESVRRKLNGDVVSAKCSHVSYPHHPHRTRRRPCGSILMKTMRSRTGKTFLYPKQVYCFKKVSDSLQEFINKPNFMENCEKWRNRSAELPNDVLGDCFEGRVWKEFQYVDGEPFLAVPNNFGLMLNVDWFQPTLHGSDSIGVIYLVVMNLPREERFKPENLIIAGIIPGPKEPKHNINSFLQPLVDDLIDLWDGVILDTNSYSSGEMFRAAILALSSDIPATRKCGGFVGHTAKKGCSKCFKEFPRASFGEKPDFSGFDRGSWEPRTNEVHRAAADKVRQAKTPSESKKFASSSGARYSVLFQLPYYDAIRFALIDPMHNLLLGTAKHVLKTWIEMGILTEPDMQKLQKRVNLVEPPSEIGRIPSKISEGFKGFTADQWKNWVCIYSLFALKGVIPREHYAMWTAFVHACQLLCCKVITKEECREADQKLIRFCVMFEALCGKDKCTPNMHLHGHLQDCILDYGPVFSFWCFSFERYNGMLGDYHTNNVDIGVQMMRKFLREKELKRTIFPEGMEECQQLLDCESKQKGTLLEASVRIQQFRNMIESETGSPADVILSKTETQVPLPPIKRNALDGEDVRRLHKTYETMYDAGRILHVSNFCDKFKHLLFKGFRYTADSTCHQQASTVLVQWFDDSRRPAIIREFLQHDVTVKMENGKSQRITHILALVEWYARHPQCNRYSTPVEVWANYFESIIPEHAFYVPVGRFQSNCVSVTYQVPLLRHQQEKVCVIISLLNSVRV